MMGAKWHRAALEGKPQNPSERSAGGDGVAGVAGLQGVNGMEAGGVAAAGGIVAQAALEFDSQTEELVQRQPGTGQ
jgi:hypothetical protein